MFIEFPAVSNVVVQDLDAVELPAMFKVRQKFDSASITDVRTHLIQELDRLGLPEDAIAGKRICIGVGSRSIPELKCIVRTLCDWLKEHHGHPFIIPAMGSHGGATAEGQMEILRGYGISEEEMDVPIISSMQVVQYGTLEDGTALYCDKNAYNADAVILINKEKPHTCFRGSHESGLAKMIAIGFAKHKGAASFHRAGFHTFAERIPQAAECFLKTCNVLMGIGIVENAYDKLCRVTAARAEDVLAMDAENLEFARHQLANFKFNSADVLVIDEIGKNISGHGHDPNITGRAAVPDDSFSRIFQAQRMVILGVTEQSHHNGNGIADADITTRRCLNSIDWSVVWTNILTSNEIRGCKIPMYANCDREAIRIAARTCMNTDLSRLKLVRIQNTLQTDCIEVSEALYDEIKDNPEIERLEGPYHWKFDDAGDFCKEETKWNQ